MADPPATRLPARRWLARTNDRPPMTRLPTHVDEASEHIPGTSHRLDGPLLRPEQAAALLAVKTSWVYDAVRTGRLPCIRVGRHIRFTRLMLEEWIEGA